MLKILITGGCGFVGTNLTLKLLNHFSSIKIFLYDNFYRKENIDNVRFLKNKNIKIIKKDCSKIKRFELVDLVIHLASDPAVGSGMTYKSKIFSNNLTSTNNLLNFYSNYKTPIIFLSSSRVYSIDTINSLDYVVKNFRYEINNNKFKGVLNKSFNEKLSTNGFKSIYGFTKLASEDLILQYSRIHDFNYIINRSGLISGKYQRGNIQQGIISFLVKNALEKKPFKIFGHKGYQVRDILNVENLCDLFILQIDSILSKKNQKNIYNIGGGYKNSESLINLIKILNQKIKLNFEIDKNERFGDIKYYISSNAKLMKDYKWKPNINYNDSIEESINFMKSLKG